MLLARTSPDVLSQLDRFKESFLWAAAKGGRVEECEMLIQMGTDVNWVSHEGDTPLLAACYNGHSSAAMCLLHHGAEVNFRAMDGQTPLHLSCRKGDEALAEALIRRGANPSVVDNNGLNPFHTLGPHAPTGMLQRLESMVHQRQGGSVQNYGQGESMALHEINNQGEGTHVNFRDRRRSKGHRRRFRRREPELSMNGPDAPTVGEEVIATSGSSLIEAMIADSGISNESEPRSPPRANEGQEGEVGQVRALETSLGQGRMSNPSSTRTGGPSDQEPGMRTTFPAIATSTIPTPLRRSPTEFLPPRRRRGPIGRLAGNTADREEPTPIPGGEQPRAPEIERPSSRNDSSSSDDLFSLDDEEEEIFERSRRLGTPTRLLQDRQGLERDADEGGRTSSLVRRPSHINAPGVSVDTDLHLLATGEPVPHAAAALAAAIASATHTADISYHASPSVLPSPRSSRSTPEGDILGSEREDSRSRIFHFGSPRELTGALLASHGQASTRGGCGTISISRVVGPEDRERSRLSSGGTAYSGESEPSLGAEVRGEGFADDFRVTTGTEPASDHVSVIRMLWLQEKETRLAAEAKADAVRDHSARLWNELVRSEKQVLSLEEALAGAKDERDTLRATLKAEGIKGKSLQELEQMEKELKKALDGVCHERDKILQEQLVKEEQRLCVVCQETERGVLLLPCRHLCVCKGCSERQELTLCPLCRDGIVEKLVVYS